MLSDSQKVGLRLQRQIAVGKPATQIEELDADAGRGRRFTKAGMAGPTNKQHLEKETPEKHRDFFSSSNNTTFKKNRGGNTWSHHVSAILFHQNAQLGYLHHAYDNHLYVTNAHRKLSKPNNWQKQHFVVA